MACARTRPGDPLHHREWPGAARRWAPYRCTPRTRPAEYSMPEQRRRLTAGTARCLLFPAQERYALWGWDSNTTAPGSRDRAPQRVYSLEDLPRSAGMAFALLGVTTLTLTIATP